MEAVQFHPRMKPLLQSRHDLIAQERLSPMRKESHDGGQPGRHCQEPAPNPPEPTLSAPERSPKCRQLFLLSRFPLFAAFAYGRLAAEEPGRKT
jgi:hypothetical protein